MATMRQIAQKAGVSVATVSRAMHEPEKLTESMLAKVFDAQKRIELNEAAGGRTIGLSVQHMSNPFFYEVVRFLDMYLRMENYTTVSIFSGSSTSLKHDIENLQACCIKALVLMPPFQMDGIDEAWLRKLGIPVIQVFSKPYDCFDSICVNDERGGYIAAKHLLMAGHRKILYIGVKGLHWQGFLRAHEEMKIKTNEENALFIQVMRDQLGAIGSKINRMEPTAVFTHTEYVTLETIQACRYMNIQIPQDLSVVAYDDYPWMAVQGISAVSHPLSGLAQSLCQLILQRLQEKPQSEPQHLVIEPRLINRDSVLIHRW